MILFYNVLYFYTGISPALTPPKQLVEGSQEAVAASADRPWALERRQLNARGSAGFRVCAVASRPWGMGGVLVLIEDPMVLEAHFAGFCQTFAVFCTRPREACVTHGAGRF